MRRQIFVAEALVALWQVLALEPGLNSDMDRCILPTLPGVGAVGGCLTSQLEQVGCGWVPMAVVQLGGGQEEKGGLAVFWIKEPIGIWVGGDTQMGFLEMEDPAMTLGAEEALSLLEGLMPELTSAGMCRAVPLAPGREGARPWELAPTRAVTSWARALLDSCAPCIPAEHRPSRTCLPTCCNTHGILQRTLHCGGTKCWLCPGFPAEVAQEKGST